MSELELSLELTPEDRLDFALEELEPVILDMRQTMKSVIGEGGHADIAATMIVDRIMEETVGSREWIVACLPKSSVEEFGVLHHELSALAKELKKKPQYWLTWYRVSTRTASIRRSYEAQLKLLR